MTVSEPAAWPRRPAAALACGTVAAALYLLALALPNLGVLAVGAGLPLAVCRLEWGRGHALAACSAAGALVVALTDPAHALHFAVTPAVPALLLAEAIALGRGISAGMLWSGLWLSAVIAAALARSAPELKELTLAPLAHYRSEEFLAEMRVRDFPEEQVELFAEQVRTLERGLEVVYPAALLLLGGIAVVIEASLLRLYVTRRAPGLLEGRGFSDLRLPLIVVVAFVASGATLMFPALRPIAYNLLVVVAFLFALQGLAVVVCYASRMPGPPLLRGAIVALMVVIPVGAYAVPLVGLFDTWFDFRRWAPRPPGTGGETQMKEER